MSKFHYGQTRLNAGIYDSLMAGYRDAPKREASVKDAYNVIPMVQGGVSRRGGTGFIVETKHSDMDAVVIGFKFSSTDAVVIEIGHNYMRFIEDRVQLMDGSVPYEISTPYDQADFFDEDGVNKFQFLQIADVTYICLEGYRVKALKRFGSHDWELTDMSFKETPYLPRNTTSTMITANSTDDVLTATSTVGINGGQGFIPSDVGNSIRIENLGGNRNSIYTITEWISSTSVRAEHDGDSYTRSTLGNPSVGWRLGVMNEFYGYPTVIGLLYDRIVLAGQPNRGDFFYLSAVGGYSPDEFDFSPSDRDLTVADDDAIFERVGGEQVNRIQWVSNNNNGLVIGTSETEWLLSRSTTTQSLSPTNREVNLITTRGSSKITATSNGFTNIFVQSTRSKVHEVAFSFEVNSYRTPEISVFCRSLLSGNRVNGMAFCQEPDNLFWFTTEDGSMFALTYFSEENVIAWSRHQISGTNARVLPDPVSVPSPDGSKDDLYFVIEREINGETKKYIEYISNYYDTTTDRCLITYADSFKVYEGEPTSIFSGLEHLEGETVGVLVDGRSHPDLVVTNGQVELLNGVTGSKIVVGLKYEWSVVFQDPHTPTQDGTNHAKQRAISDIVVNCWNTLGMNYGHEGEENPAEVLFRYGIDFDNAVELFTGDTDPLQIVGNNYRITNVELGHDGMFPACILGIRYRINFQDR